MPDNTNRKQTIEGKIARVGQSIREASYAGATGKLPALRKTRRKLIDELTRLTKRYE